MKIYKITEASEHIGVSINTLKTLANNGKINSFKTSGGHRRFRQDDLDSYMGVKKENPTMTVREILQTWLKCNGFDGLAGEDKCGCEINNLMPQGGCSAGCVPGFRVQYKATDECGLDCTGRDHWHIEPEKARQP